MDKPDKPRRVMARGYQKTSTITVRLSPKHRYALDLLARLGRQTVSATIETLIRDRFGAEQTAPREGPPDSGDADLFASAMRSGQKSAGEVLSITWDPREADRFLNVASCAPGLLTEEEELTWRLIREAPALWKGRELDREQVRIHWDAILKAARRGAPSLRHLDSKA